MWLPEFQAIVDQAGARRDESPLDLRIDDPQSGRIVGEGSFEAYRDWSAEWLSVREGRVQAIATTVGEGRAVGEFELDLAQDGRTFALPVAVVVEPDLEAAQLAVRVYHSQWPLLGHHVIRPPLLSRDPNVRESDIVGEYQSALGAGDIQPPDAADRRVEGAVRLFGNGEREMNGAEEQGTDVPLLADRRRPPHAVRPVAHPRGALDDGARALFRARFGA